ncbi:hypothetical protein CRYUN_Cryun25bG0004800 [Craigia yunnanensis]
MPPPCMVREQDQYMPIANVIRIMRRILPSHAKISDDAKETIQECVSEYISFITGEANERCQREQRKTITAEDVLWAMGKLGFDDYVEPLTVFLSRYRQTENERTSLRGEPILKRGIDYETMVMAPYGPAFHTGHYQGIFDAATAMGGYYRDASGAAAESSSQASLTNNFDPFELNKEDLISGLLLPHPQSSIPYCSLYQQPVVTTDNVQLAHVLCSRVDALSEGLDQCLSVEADEQDPSVTSPPQDCRDGIIPDICADPGLSLAKIQRSKSRQQALEHRNSAKACKNVESFEKNGDACSSQNERSKIASLRSDPVDKLEIGSGHNVVSCEVEKEERGQCWSRESTENVYSGRVTRSRSFIQPSKSVSRPSGAGSTSCVAKQDGVVLTESNSKSRQQHDVVHELLESKFFEPVNNTVSCAVKIEERGQCWSRERGEDIYSGRIIRSRSSVQPPKSVNSPSSAGESFPVAKQDGIVLMESINKSRLRPDGADELLQFVKPVDNVITSVVAKKERGQCRSKERGENIYSGSIKRSKSSV